MAYDPSDGLYSGFNNDLDYTFYNPREHGLTADSPAPIDPSTLRPSDGSDVYYLPNSGTSGRDVVSTPVSASSPEGTEASMSAMLEHYFDQIMQLTDRNSARSEEQAALLRDWQERQNQKAMTFNSTEAAKNRDWQKMMSDTAHQREIADLQAAGLNPVLSAMGGQGAPVTSGATASGVTSAGAKGEVDTSATGALVSLLGTMWTAQTQLEMQRNNAQTNLAIAEKQNATSQLIAELYTQQSREASILASETSLQSSQISAAVSELVSRISANASYYSSNIAHQNAILQSEASKVVAGMNVEASKYNTLVNGIVDLAQSQMSFDIADLTSGRQAQSAMDVAQENHANSQMGTLFNIWKTGTGYLSELFKSSRTGGFYPNTGGYSRSQHSYSQK